MFDPSKYSMPKIRRLPVILLLDVSGSMYGQKIEELYDAVNKGSVIKDLNIKN